MAASLPSLTSILFQNQAQPDSVKNLAGTGSETPEQIAEKRKKLLAAGQGDAMARYGLAGTLMGLGS